MRINLISNNSYFPCYKNNISNKKTLNFTGDNLSVEDKLNAIFSPNELQKAYNDISKFYKLDISPKLNLIPTYKSGWGGGYNFKKHEVSLCMEDLTCCDYKIVGTKNGKKTVLVSPSTLLPLFADEKLAKEFLANAPIMKNYGFDKVEMLPTTKEDKRRFVLQKISHELVHAQQHQILRQTDGIGEKEILKAWTHIKPNDKNYQNIDKIVEQDFKDSFWANRAKTPKILNKDKVIGMLASIWLDAIRNYPPVDSPEYARNAIEIDAYKRSAQYVQSLFGLLKA